MAESATQTAATRPTSPGEVGRFDGAAPRPGIKKLTIRNQAPTGLTLRSVHTSVSEKYLPWGPDNRYPQRVLEAVAASGTAAVCVALKAKFIEGNGFKDATFYKAVVNKKHQTLDQLVRLHAADIAQLEGMVALLNFNALGEPCEVYFVQFALWRPGVADEDGLTRSGYIIEKPSVLVRTNSIVKTKAKKYNLFNPKEAPAERLARVTTEMAAEGKPFTEYPGELAVYFHTTPASLSHPRPAYDPVMRDIVSEAAMKVARHVDIRNGFASQVMITEFGTPDPDEAKLRADEEKYGDMIGEEAARLIVQYAQNKDSKPEIDELPAPDASARYASEGAELRSNIRAAFQIPDILYGEPIAGKLGTSQEFDDALNYVQRLVINRDQRAIEQFYKEIFSGFVALGTTEKANLNPTGDYSLENLTLKPTAAVPSEAEKTLKAFATISPLVLTQVVRQMSAQEIRGLVGLGVLKDGEVAIGASAGPDPVMPPANVQ